ncbi:MAG: AraC family transcriptional regulator [Capsulimonadaceae bacterium]|nr:AraC family transcriptional regulator [Capsulimonadaceae bacterium]
MTDATFMIAPDLAVRVQNAGLFVSRGVGIHPDRRIDSHELIFVREGVLGIAEEERRFEVRAGEALILWPGRRHYGTIPYAPELSFYWIHFVVDNAAGGRGDAIRVAQNVRVARPDHLTWLLRRFLEDQQSGDLDRVSASLLLLQMLREASLPERAGEHDGGGGALSLASKADGYIRTHFELPLSASLIASELNCNANYLNVAYRRCYGITVTEAIHGHRMRHARRLLTDGDGNIDEVARACGFTDTGYFRRLFHRSEGMSPKAFRRLYARVHLNTM